MSEQRQAELPNGWALTTLGEPLRWGSGGTPLSSRRDFYGGEIPWAVIGDLNDGIVDKTATSITEEGLNGSSAKWVEPGSVLLAMYGSIGKLGINSIRLATNQAIAFTLPDPLSTKYLFYYLMSAQPELISCGKGGTQSNISQTVIKLFPFIVAPLPEQNRIVDVIESHLTRLDDAMATLERVQRNLKRYRASVLKAAVEGRLVPTEAELARKEGRAYEPASVLLERILAERRRRWEEAELAKLKAKGKVPKDDKWKARYVEPAAPDTSELPELPEGWCWSSLGELFEVKVGATPSRSMSEYWSGSIPWVSSGEVSFCRIARTREMITEAGLHNSSTQLNPPGSVLLGMIGEGKTRGQVAILSVAACNSQNSAAIWVSDSGIPPEYVYHYLVSQYEVNRRLGSGNNQPVLNKSRVQAIPIPLPPLAESWRIVAELEKYESTAAFLLNSVQGSLARCQRLRQSILKWAFEGRLVDQDPSDEPASVLLERIQAERAAAAGNAPRRSRRVSANATNP